MEIGIDIRLAESTDFKTIYDIWLEGVENSFDIGSIDIEILKRRFKTNFNKRSGIFNFWVAEKDGVILGWQSLIRATCNPFRIETNAESSTYISKENRVKGVGEMLIGYVMQQAEKSQLEHIIGYVAIDNIAARKITQRTGWIEVGEIPPSLKNKNGKRKLLLMRPV